MTVPSECERGDRRGQFGPDVVCCDQELRLNGERGREGQRQACKAIARSPGASRGFAFLRHGSGLPCDQGVQRLCRNDRPAPDANSAKATSRNVIVESSPAKAGCMAGFPNAVADLRGIVFDGLH